MAQRMPNFIMEDGTVREFTAEDLERLMSAVGRTFERMCAAGDVFITTNADEVV
ncbi:hypothetical protein J3S85_37950 [Streptomyces lavenduligriseus]|nr:hypothetical protein J3S85_37950 [Streptomyces lavenduligriseus]